MSPLNTSYVLSVISIHVLCIYVTTKYNLALFTFYSDKKQWDQNNKVILIAKLPSPGTILWFSPSDCKNVATVSLDGVPPKAWLAWAPMPCIRRANASSVITPAWPPVAWLSTPEDCKQTGKMLQWLYQFNHNNYTTSCIITFKGNVPINV